MQVRARADAEDGTHSHHRMADSRFLTKAMGRCLAALLAMVAVSQLLVVDGIKAKARPMASAAASPAIKPRPSPFQPAESDRTVPPSRHRQHAVERIEQLMTGLHARPPQFGRLFLGVLLLRLYLFAALALNFLQLLWHLVFLGLPSFVRV